VKNAEKPFLSKFGDGKENKVLYKKHTHRYLIRRGKPLTICIAAICEANKGNPRIVFCSDRLVTDAHGLTFEQGIPKVIQLLPNCLVMNAGDASRGDVILRDVFTLIGSYDAERVEKMTILEIAELIKSKYDIHKDKAIEDDIFRPRGFDRKFFYANIKSFYDWLALMIDTEVRNYVFDVAFIILGFDISQEKKSVVAHLYQLSNGELQFLTPMGFSMVGIGSYQSLPEITKEPYNPSISLSDCIVRTFWAKKLSERMVSVGKETTDLGIAFLELDATSGKIVAKNTLLLDDFKKKYLLGSFEEQKQAMKDMSQTVQKSIDEVFQGKKAVGTN
jgi:hypothetical protein